MAYYKFCVFDFVILPVKTSKTIMSITAKNLTKYYNKQKALDNVSFSISKGEIVGLLGPNGAGKSTLMKILTCFIPPTQGNAFINGYDIAEQASDVKKQIGYLPENNPLYQDMYVREYLTFVANLAGISHPKSRLDDIIRETGLTKEQKKKIAALSKGYKQRVGLAQALISQPEVLILDEPTSGLDPNQLVEIRNLIRETGRQKTVLLSTHIMQEVEAICDRVIIINNGKIIADDTTANISKRYGSKNYVLVEFDKPVHGNELSQIEGVTDVMGLNNNQWKIYTNNIDSMHSRLFDFAVKNNTTIVQMQKEAMRLEEIFQQLTKE
jgi:ABC-2 type transport system ATP-binding protein